MKFMTVRIQTTPGLKPEPWNIKKSNSQGESLYTGLG